ncbi:trypsin-like peptidase domain-containing protein [Streptomyces roseoverticillatus]|uniref:trypsin-like serine peptidase n=1 Tax=Streptomyces roseoverticillatus TaxID=66429 RepID=UPI0034104B19
MRQNASGPRPAAVTALVAAVLALAAAGLVVANQGLATDSPVADGDASGHYAQTKAQGDETAEAMRSAVRSENGTAPLKPASSGKTDPLPTSEPLRATESAPSPAVGPLFYTGQGAPGHGCSASVVHSPKGDLIVTAAHCVYQDGFRTDIAFVPGYRDGVAPYGVWVPVSVDIDPEWAADRDPDHDVAFLRVRRPGTDTRAIEQVTGAERIRFRPPVGRQTRVTGYPVTEERPVSCQNATKSLSPTQLRFDCADLPNGTSGGPFLTDVDPATGLGTVNGVVGGHDEGGDEATSYSSYFGDGTESLYRRATAA